MNRSEENIMEEITTLMLCSGDWVKSNNNPKTFVILIKTLRKHFSIILCQPPKPNGFLCLSLYNGTPDGEI